MFTRAADEGHAGAEDVLQPEKLVVLHHVGLIEGRRPATHLPAASVGKLTDLLQPFPFARRRSARM